MKGYVVCVYKNITNEEKLKEYAVKARAAVEKFKGKFLIRGGNQIEFEEKGFDRTVVVEFESYQDALNCYNSREYQSAKKFVRNSSKSLVAVVEGLK